MYSLNSKTKVDKNFKLTDLLKRMKADKMIKAEAASIESVSLEHTLSQKTMHIKDDDQCREIYIFRIKLKEKQVPELFIKRLDESIGLHTYYILEYQDQVKELVIYREVHGETIKRHEIYETDWQEEKLEEMPYCSSLLEIYEHLIKQIIPLVPKEGEEINDFFERYHKVQRLKKDIAVKESKAQREKQPRKKLDLAREVTKLKRQLNEIL